MFLFEKHLYLHMGIEYIFNGIYLKNSYLHPHIIYEDHARRYIY